MNYRTRELKHGHVITGKVVSVPELASTPKGMPVCTFFIQSNRNRRSKIVSFADIAINAQQRIKYGMEICVQGHVRERSWKRVRDGREIRDIFLSAYLILYKNQNNLTETIGNN